MSLTALWLIPPLMVPFKYHSLETKLKTKTKQKNAVPCSKTEESCFTLYKISSSQIICFWMAGEMSNCITCTQDWSCCDGWNACDEIKGILSSSTKYNVVSFAWCFQPSQPLRIISKLKTNFNPSLSYRADKSLNVNHNFSTT